MALPDTAATASAYDRLAPAYDLLTAGYAYGPWLRAIEGVAIRHGLAGRRALDVACGTGSTLAALLDLGYAAQGCDGSPGMVAVARAKLAGRAAVAVADMCALPVLGAFDLVTCLDDAFNHLPSRAHLVAALRGIEANLAPGGLLAFDVNTLRAYRDPHDRIVQDPDRIVLWHGEPARLLEAGGSSVIAIDVLDRRDDDLWRRSSVRWEHWHHPVDVVAEAVAAAGLALLAVHGQRTGGQLDPQLDEEHHAKALLLVGRRSPDARGGLMVWQP